MTFQYDLVGQCPADPPKVYQQDTVSPAGRAVEDTFKTRGAGWAKLIHIGPLYGKAFRMIDTGNGEVWDVHQNGSYNDNGMPDRRDLIR
jgi:hypothetical protein